MDSTKQPSKALDSALCLKCRRPDRTRLPGKQHCDDCAIGAIWTVSRSTAKIDDHEPISLTRDQFVVWYKTQRGRCAGRCPWCGDPFGKRGPAADYDRSTGEPRALICMPCNMAKSVGLKRLKCIVAALELWATGARSTSPMPAELGPESNFERWARHIERARLGRDKRTVKVVHEMRKLVPAAEFDALYRKFRLFMEEREDRCRP